MNGHNWSLLSLAVPLSHTFYSILPSCPSGAHTLLNISSKPTLAEPDEFIVRSIADGWEQVVLHLQNDFFGGLAITTDEFYDDLIATATIVSGLGRNHCKDSSYRNLVGPLLEVLGGNGLGALVVIAILLLQSGDVETNPGPVERGGWLCLVNSVHESCTYCTVIQVMLAVTNTLVGSLARLKSWTSQAACQCAYQGVFVVGRLRVTGRRIGFAILSL